MAFSALVDPNPTAAAGYNVFHTPFCTASGYLFWQLGNQGTNNAINFTLSHGNPVYGNYPVRPYSRATRFVIKY